MEEGVLRYRVTDPRRIGIALDLTPATDPGVVEPTILHHVELLGRVRFHVEFFRETAESVSLCRHEKLVDRENRERSRL